MRQLRNNSKLAPITPDLTLSERIKVVPDTKIERILYKMLLDQMQENEVLKFRIKQLKDSRKELARKRSIKRKIRSLVPKLGIARLEHPAHKGEGL